MMKKRMLSLLLAAMLCVGMLPAALAEEAAQPQSETAHAAHRLCGDESCTDTNHDHTAITDWQGVTTLPTKAGHYYLENDVQTSGTWTPADGVVLCLNGKKITGSITVSSGRSFTLTDCKTTGQITGSGYLVSVSGTFTQYNGTISSGELGVSVYGGSFTMNGGAITKNVENGVRAVNDGTFTMNGGSIMDNGHDTRDTTGFYGVELGGYNCSNGNFVMNGGSIYGNYRGGVNIGWRGNSGGGFTMTGGEITGNHGCGVVIVAADFIVSGDAKVYGNIWGGTQAADGKYYGDEQRNVYVCDGRTITIADSELSGSFGVIAANPGNITTIATGTGLTTETAAKFHSDKSDYDIVLNSDGTELKLRANGVSADEHVHYLCGETCTGVGSHTDKKTVFEPWKSISSLPDTAGNYYLTENVTLSETWEPADGVALCLNGHTITLDNGTSTKFANVIEVTNHFTLTDCQTGDVQGKITHAAAEDDTKGKGVGVAVIGGTFDMYGGTITGNKANYTYGGSGVAVRNENAFHTGKDGAFNMYGGKISSNQAGFGGGVSVMWGAVFHMMGVLQTNVNS